MLLSTNESKLYIYIYVERAKLFSNFCKFKSRGEGTQRYAVLSFSITPFFSWGEKPLTLETRLIGVVVVVVVVRMVTCLPNATFFSNIKVYF